MSELLVGLVLGTATGLMFGWLFRGHAERVDLREKSQRCTHPMGCWVVGSGTAWCLECERAGEYD